MRRKKDNEKPRRGRPQKLGEADLARVRELADAGLSVEQIASQMGTSRKSVETLIDERDLKAEIRTRSASAAALSKLLVYDEIKNGNLEVAKWYLQHEARLKSEAERMRLVRMQRKALEQATNPEQAPDALPPGEYWTKVHNYFMSRDNPKPEQSDNPGDQTSTADPGESSDKAGD